MCPEAPVTTTLIGTGKGVRHVVQPVDRPTR